MVEVVATGLVWTRRWLVASLALSLVSGAGFCVWAATDALDKVFHALMISPRSLAYNFHMTGFQGLDEGLRDLGLPSEGDLFLFSNHYMDSALISWATRARYPVLCLSQRPVGFAFVPHAAGRVGANGLCITREKYTQRVPKDFGRYFERSEYLGMVKVGHRGHREILYLHLFQNMSTLFPLPYGG